MRLAVRSNAFHDNVILLCHNKKKQCHVQNICWSHISTLFSTKWHSCLLEISIMSWSWVVVNLSSTTCFSCNDLSELCTDDNFYLTLFLSLQWFALSPLLLNAYKKPMTVLEKVSLFEIHSRWTLLFHCTTAEHNKAFCKCHAIE